MQIVLIIIGALLGAAAHDGTGVLLGAAVGWVVARVLRQQREIDDLRQRLGILPAAKPIWQPAPEEKAVADPPAMPSAEPIALAVADPKDEAPAAAMPPPAPPAPRGPGPFDALRRWFFGGNTIVKAGVGILFIGLAFLAKYAAEHVSLPIELRLAGIGAFAIVLLAVGWRLRGARAAYAQVLQGGAIAVLYLTLFAAFKFYGVIGGMAAFVLMALVAALAAALAVLQDARALAAVGALGGYATPLLLSSGGGSHVALFSYYLVLGCGVAAVAWFRTWRELNLIAFFFTFGVGTAWGVLSYREYHYASAQAFLIAFFLLFIAVLLAPARRLAVVAEGSEAPPPPLHERWINGSLLFGLPTLTFALQYGLVQHTRWGAALSALALAAFYVGIATLLRGKPRLALAFEGSLAVGTVFLTLVIPFALDQRSTAGAWALEGAGLIWLGWRQARWLARGIGYALILIAGFVLLHAIDHHAMPTSWINATLLSGLMLIAGSLVAALVTQRHAPRGSPVGERVAEPLLIAWALLAAAGLISLHVMALVEPLLRLSGLILGLGLVALLFTVLAWRLNWTMAAWPVLGLAPLALFAAMLGADFQRHPFAQGGWWAWPVVFAAHALALQRIAAHWPALGEHVAHACGALVLALLGASAGRGLFAEAGDTGSAWPWLGWLAVPALMLLALLREKVAALWPPRLLPEAYQRSAAGVLAVVMLAWTLLANIASNGAARPLPYLPFVNPLDLGIALALFAAWRWMASAHGVSTLGRRPWLPPALLAGFGFVWLNAMLVRGFHHFGDVPFRLDAWTDSLPVHTGLTLLWSATALVLMWVSARRALRVPWMVGAALLAVVVLKLMLVDLSASGAVTRIVSFIGAGVLMLVIGYVAPLPAAAAAKKEEEARHA